MSVYQTYLRLRICTALLLLASANSWAQSDPTRPPVLPGNGVVTVSEAGIANKDYASVGEALEALKTTAGTVTLNLSTGLEGMHALSENVTLNLNGLNLGCSSGTTLKVATGKTIQLTNRSSNSISHLTGSLTFTEPLFVDQTVEMKAARVYEGNEVRYRVLVALPTGVLQNVNYNTKSVNYVRLGNVMCCWLPESASPYSITFHIQTLGGSGVNYKTDPITVTGHLQVPLTYKEDKGDVVKNLVEATPTGGTSTTYTALEPGLESLATSGGMARLLDNCSMVSEKSFAADVLFDLEAKHLSGSGQAGLLTTGNATLHLKSMSGGIAGMSGNFSLNERVCIDKTVALTASILIGTSQVYRVRVILPDDTYTYYKYNATTYKEIVHKQKEGGKQVAYLWLPALSIPSSFMIANNASGSNAKTLNNVTIEANHDNEVDATLGDIQASVYETGVLVDSYEQFHYALEAIQTKTRRLVLRSDVSLNGVTTHSHTLDASIQSEIDLNRHTLLGENGTLDATNPNACYLITDASGIGSITGTLQIKGNVYIGKDIAASKVGTVKDMASGGGNIVYRLLVAIDGTVSNGFYSYTDGSSLSGSCYIKENVACLWLPANTKIDILTLTVHTTKYTARSVQILASHTNTVIARLPDVVAKIGSTTYTRLVDAFGAVVADNTEIEVYQNTDLATDIDLAYKNIQLRNNYLIEWKNTPTFKGNGSVYIYGDGVGSMTGDFSITDKVCVSSSVKLGGEVKLDNNTVYRTALVLPEGTTSATYTLQGTAPTGSPVALLFPGEQDRLKKVIAYAWIKSGTYSKLEVTATVAGAASQTLTLENLSISPLHTNRYDMTTGGNVAEVDGNSYPSFASAIKAANSSVGREVKILTDLFFQEAHTISTDITLDLNSHILIGAVDAALLINDGKTLTVTDRNISLAQKGSLYGTLRFSGCLYVSPEIKLAGTFVREGIEVFRCMVDGFDASLHTTFIYGIERAAIQSGKACLWLPPTLQEQDVAFSVNGAPFELTLTPILPDQNALGRAYKVIQVDANTEWAGSDNQDCNIVVKAGAVLTIPERSTLETFHRIVLEEGSQVVCLKPTVLVTGGIIYRRPFKTANQWESFSLPFNARRITALQDGELIEMQPYQVYGTGGHFWLKSLVDDGSFQHVAEREIKANKGYIIAVPANLTPGGIATNPGMKADYIDFTSPDNQYLARTPVPATPPTSTRFKVLANGTYQNQLITQTYYQLSNSGQTYERIIASTTTPSNLSPFNSYLLADQVTTTNYRSLRMDGLPTANEEIKGSLAAEPSLTWLVSPGILQVEAVVNTRLLIYDVQGRLILSRQLPPGSTRLTLASGIYIVNGAKVYIPQ